eukprot:TRINITY_DN2557_c0_g1_i5.p2 TRINITY_DN2557_c0_g1~~TRINITY_DN2557_c0_g1_i5.p2  ORF type:complete len:135 (-),score=33.26 TRINITY_DN2557_c0_g1_i5:87-491(-)
MMRRPPRSTLSSSSAASDVYKRQEYMGIKFALFKFFSKNTMASAIHKKIQRITTPPVNLIFRFFQTKAIIEVWLYENQDTKFEGRIIGFDEYMNLTLENAVEVNTKKNTRSELGRILLKGDNITLLRNISDITL